MIEKAEALRVLSPDSGKKVVIVTMTDENGVTTIKKLGGDRATRAKAVVINCETGNAGLRSDVLAAAREADKNTKGFTSGYRGSSFKFDVPPRKHMMITVAA